MASGCGECEGWRLGFPQGVLCCIAGPSSIPDRRQTSSPFDFPGSRKQRSRITASALGPLRHTEFVCLHSPAQSVPESDADAIGGLLADAARGFPDNKRLASAGQAALKAFLHAKKRSPRFPKGVQTILYDVIFNIFRVDTIPKLISKRLRMLKSGCRTVPI